MYVLVSFYVLHIVPRLFSLNQIGQPGSLVLFVAPYLAACIFFAMTTSIAIRNRETCMLIFVFTSVPLLFISGISWPGAAIPPFWKYVSYIFPSTFGINGFVKINNMGATLSEVAFEYKALWIQAGIYFLTTCWVYRWQILMSRKHAIERYKELKEKENLSFILICHDLALVQAFCDKVLVLYHGKTVEYGTPDDIINHPKMDYTKKLIDSVL